jgi:hypothetical protein
MSVCLFSSTKIWIRFEINLILDYALKLLSWYSLLVICQIQFYAKFKAGSNAVNHR